MPYYPKKDGKELIYDVATYWEKLVCDYANLSILDVNELNYVDYLIVRRDAFIWQMEQTDEGREYLENAKRINNTEIDRKALKEKFGKKGDK